MKALNRILNKIIYIIIIVFVIGIIYDTYKNDLFDDIDKSAENAIVDNSITDNDISNSIIIEDGKLNIIYFDVGQADSTLIVCDGNTVLIDAGNTYDGSKIVKGIKDLGIKKIDYVIGTHVHEDHLGGMSYVIDNFDIGNYYMPYCSSNENSFYSRLLLSLSNKNLPINKIEIGEKIALGNGILEVMGVRNDEPENLNETSITLELSYGKLKYLFMADAEIVNEEERTWNDVDVLKVGHHGSISSTSNEFLSQVLPEVSIISVGKDNDYNLPEEDVLKRLYEMGSQIYRTDQDGTIEIISDGEQNEILKIDISFDG